MLRNVAVVVMDGVAAFELGVLCEVFGTDRTADGFPGYRFDICSPDGGPVRAQNGFTLVRENETQRFYRLDRLS